MVEVVGQVIREFLPFACGNLACQFRQLLLNRTRGIVLLDVFDRFDLKIVNLVDT